MAQPVSKSGYLNLWAGTPNWSSGIAYSYMAARDLLGAQPGFTIATL